MTEDQEDTPKKKKKKSSSSVIINSFIEGMNKDISQSMEPSKSWWHARNAANNSTGGDMGVIGNEPANLHCGAIPYTIIGAIYRFGDEWVIFSTDDINSEIGRFDDSECKYTTLVNDPCLAFNREFLITGASKENFDCTWQVYWDDSNNPSRSLNIDDIPYIQEMLPTGGGPCVVFGDDEPLKLDCEKIRLAPLVDTPCIELTKAIDGGMLINGSYQAFIAYTEAEQRVTDYIGVSNVQTLWSHEGSNGSLNLSITNLDKDFENFELVILIRNQGQTFAKRVGLYSTQRQDINIDYIDPAVRPMDLQSLPRRSPAYEKSEAMFVVNDWLLRQGPVEQFDFNYQPIANDIRANFVVNKLPAKYYHLGGNKYGFLRDEQYAFFIRWIYNTGERSSSYHIPGRAPRPFPNVIVDPPNPWETDDDFSVNALDPNGDLLFKVYNTGIITSLVTEPQPDGSTITARGDMGYWESTERYPTNRPDIWGDLCGEFIRHHKMPAEDCYNCNNNSPLHLSVDDGDYINLLGVEFTNIGQPKDNDGEYLTNVVGYEILKGARDGAKSILAKGLFRNMREYDVPNTEDLIGAGVQGLYPNYPYNDLRPDIYFHNEDHDPNSNEITRTEGCHNFNTSIDEYPPLSGYSKKVFTFSSPDLMFTKPFLNAYETRIYGDLSGHQVGAFKPSEDHPQFKLLRNSSAVTAALIGIGYAMHEIKGDVSKEQISPSFNYPDMNDWYFGSVVAGAGGSTATGANSAATAILYGTTVAAVSAFNLGYAAGSFPLIEMSDLYAGGTVTDGVNATYFNGTQFVGVGTPGWNGSEFKITNSNTTSLSALPPEMRAIVGVITTGTNIATGGNEIIELLYNLVKTRDFVYKYNSYGSFDNFSKRNTDLWRIKNEDSNYIGQSFATFNDGEYKINNLFRPSIVAVALEKEIDIPSVSDTSRFTIGGDIWDIDNGTNDTSVEARLLNPLTRRRRTISAYYGALKFNFDNQYGQLDGIKQIPMRGCVNYIDPDKPDITRYNSKPIFSGDVFITRYTEKVIMPIFSQYLLGQPDEYTYDYSRHVNVPYPRYWLDSQKYDITKLAQTLAGPQLLISAISNSQSLDALFPKDLFYLDRGNLSCGAVDTIMGAFSDEGDPNPIFAMKYAYIYSHSNGILDFFVESEINLDHREWEEIAGKRIYNVYEYNDLTELFHAQIQKIDNYYRYDQSLSPSKLVSQLSTWGQIQARYYDPYVAANCYVSRPKRLIYSLQASTGISTRQESKRDFWRVFLNFNYKDFKTKVSVIKPMDKSGAMIFFPYLSPQLFSGIEELVTAGGDRLTIGDGGLFKQPFQNVTNSDLSNEYGSCENLRSVMNTPAGLFYISQAQGKIFQYGGKGLVPISNKGMKWWFNKYLPSQLIKQYPELEFSKLSDNTVIGVGCHSIYDSNDDIAYFMKKDYRVKSEWIEAVTYSLNDGFILESSSGKIPISIGDPLYFDDASWTISYDPKSESWISFHDWHPEFALPSINHFFTTKTMVTDIPQCPPGYNFNPNTGLCEIALTATTEGTIDVDEIASILSGGPTDCRIDLVIAMDWSSSTTSPCTPPQGNSEAHPYYFPGELTAPWEIGNLMNDCIGTAQMAWLDAFINNPSIQTLMNSGSLQIGFTGWGNWSTKWMQPNSADPAVPTYSMTNTVTYLEVYDWYMDNWGNGFAQSTDLNDAISTAFPVVNDNGDIGPGGLPQLNDKVNSMLGDATGEANFKQILIVVTDGNNLSYPDTNSPNPSVADFQTPTMGYQNTGNWALQNLGDATKQELYAVFCGFDSNVPDDTEVIDLTSGTVYNEDTETPGGNQFTMAANNVDELQQVAINVAESVCIGPWICSCDAGYTMVYQNTETNLYTQSSGICNIDKPPICRKITCSCPPSTIPDSVTTISGTCPDTPPDIFSYGDPDWINPDPIVCNYFYTGTTPPNYNIGSIWRHNVRCDSFANYYNIQYPWEIELVAASGQTVNTVRSMEYQMEAYVYKSDPGYICGDDKWEDLNFNFDQSVIYNNEQVSGLLQLTPTPFNNPILELNYPIINTNSINILCSKVEQKYRFNQFWDITNDRGEFTNAEQSIWNTEINGYIKNLNPVNLNYFKSPLQHKKFRNYFTNVILRRMDSGNRKMLLRLNNTKLVISLR